jgi:hypothetical protein
MSISTMMCLLLLAATASGQTPSPGVSKEPADAPSYTISGYVIDADTGEPVDGAQCNAANVEDFSTFASPFKSRLTESDGHFRISGLVPGIYHLSASRGSQGYTDDGSVSVVDSDVAEVTIKYHKGGRISGQVFLESSDPSVLSQLGSLIIDAMPGPADGGSLAADGSFTLDGLRPGAIGLMVSGGCGKFSIDHLERDGVAVGYVARSTIGAFILAPGENVSGLVVFVTYSDGIIKGQMEVVGGTLPPQATISVVMDTPNIDDRKLFELGLNKQLDQDLDGEGRFVIEGVRPGKHLVTLVVSGLRAGQGPVMLSGEVNVANGSESSMTLVLDLTTNQSPIDQ